MGFRVYEVGAARLASFHAGETDAMHLYDLVWLNNASRVRRVEVMKDLGKEYTGRGESNFMFRESLRKFLNALDETQHVTELDRDAADEALRAVGLESCIENPSDALPVPALPERQVLALERIAVALESISNNLNVSQPEGSFGSLMELLEKKL